MSSILQGLQLNELSNTKLGDYKTAAGADATAADKEGDYKRGDKRVSGIIKATKKEFDNDKKKKVSEGELRFDPLVAKIAAKMKGPTENDAIAALITVLGTSAYNERPGFYRLWLRQAIDKYSKEGVAEAGNNYHANRTGFSHGQRDDERHDLDTPSQVWGLKINGKVWSKGGKDVTFTSKQAALNTRNAILKNRPDLEIGLITKGGLAEEEEDKMDSRFKKTEWMPLMDAIKILKHYGATPEKYMGHEMFPYYDIEGNRKYLEDITWNADNSKNVRVSLVNQAVRELKAQKQGVAEEAMNEGVPSDNDMGVVPDVRSGTSTKMTLGQWKQMWLKKMPHADQGMFRYPPAMNGSFIAYFDGWENTPGARWDPQQSVSEEQLDELKCWSGYHRVAGTKAGFPGSCAKNKTNEEGVAEGYDPVESDYGQWEDILRRGNPSGAYAFNLMRGDETTIRNILAYVKQNRAVLGKEVSPETGRTVKDAIIDIKNEYPQLYQAAQQPQGVAEAQHSCPHCGGEMVSEELMNEKKDACYYKVKSRYKVWPSAYASGALVKCRNKGAKNWGNSTKNESSILEGIEQADESLHDWFNKEKWVRMDTKGNIKGPCAKEPGEGKPKCLPQAKAHSLGKKGRASAAARKRREDPNPERSGKAINVNTKKKSNENMDEDWKKKLGAAALAGSMALGAAGASADTRRVTPDGQGGFTGGLKPTATVVAPDNTPSATPPTSDTSDPFKGLARAERADRQAQTITVGGKEYRMVEISPTDIRPRSGKQIVVPQAVLGERSIGNYMGILTGNTVFVISKQ